MKRISKSKAFPQNPGVPADWKGALMQETLEDLLRCRKNLGDLFYQWFVFYAFHLLYLQKCIAGFSCSSKRLGYLLALVGESPPTTTSDERLGSCCEGSIFKTDVFNASDDMRNRLQQQAKPQQQATGR